ncbi:MAG: adenosylmethionine-8-amino-7-oxononanoate aminotransferase [Rhodothermales bacterium]|jgi:adenosylmethionine-8-amino-7-oxononanoate aminotransferase
MKDYESFVPLEIVGAEGPWLQLADGSQVIDAISSWWCKSLGHGHPRLRAAAVAQIERFEHVIIANTSNAPIRDLAAKLAAICAPLDRVFFSGDGSCAVEIAAKMALRAQALRGQPQRQRFMALADGYHGETAFTMGLSDLGIFKAPYASICPEVAYLQDVPLVTGSDDPGWDDCSDAWPAIEAQLAAQADDLAGIVIEPIVQGAAGMHIHGIDFLRRLRAWCTQNDVYLIADEIMTGLGRTGTALACDHADVRPDFLCLSKGLTAGWMAFSATLTTTAIYELFYDDYDTGKAFLHSNTYCGNALGVAVAREALAVYEEEQTFASVAARHCELRNALQSVADETGHLGPVRGIGAIVAADLILPSERQRERVGYAIYQRAVARGALLRPIGNTIYWLPPLNTPMDVIGELRDITAASIREVLG